MVFRCDAHAYVQGGHADRGRFDHFQTHSDGLEASSTVRCDIHAYVQGVMQAEDASTTLRHTRKVSKPPECNVHVYLKRVFC